MVRRWSKAEMWVPGTYLALVLAMLVYMAVVSRTGDIGFFGVWPILATAPVSLVLLMAVGPAAAALDETPPPVEGPVYEGSTPPPEPLPTEFMPEPTSPPADWVAPDTSDGGKFDLLGEFGFYGAILFSALVNAAAIWALLRYAARQHAARRPQL
ncbi:SCO4225 family membrane protein [Streptomyces sp. NPDC058401]|uniref:SCO4225 family membrane protein n=1 Tax=Streptomyces sp. NPDC058401 TaxID=3346480 RepID=UPI00364D6DCF